MKFNLFKLETNRFKCMIVNFLKSDLFFFSQLLSEIPAGNNTHGEYKRSPEAQCYHRGRGRMSDLAFHLDVLIEIGHTADTAPASQKFIMNRDYLQSLLSVQLPWGQKY